MSVRGGRRAGGRGQRRPWRPPPRSGRTTGRVARSLPDAVIRRPTRAGSQPRLRAAAADERDNVIQGGERGSVGQDPICITGASACPDAWWSTAESHVRRLSTSAAPPSGGRLLERACGREQAPRRRDSHSYPFRAFDFRGRARPFTGSSGNRRRSRAAAWGRRQIEEVSLARAQKHPRPSVSSRSSPASSSVSESRRRAVARVHQLERRTAGANPATAQVASASSSITSTGEYGAR